MTVLAGVGRINVLRVLPGRVDTVVATEAAARNVRVIKNRRYPGPRLVAVVAPVAGDDVIVRLACREYPVVTGITAPGHGRMVHVSQWAPRRRRMAVAAECCAVNMIGRLRGRLYRTDRGMTAGTCRARSLELAAHMAAVTSHICVRVVEVETGREMIERLLRRRRRHQQQNQEQRYNNGKCAGSGESCISVH